MDHRVLNLWVLLVNGNAGVLSSEVVYRVDLLLNQQAVLGMLHLVGQADFDLGLVLALQSRVPAYLRRLGWVAGFVNLVA